MAKVSSGTKLLYILILISGTLLQVGMAFELTQQTSEYDSICKETFGEDSTFVQLTTIEDKEQTYIYCEDGSGEVRSTIQQSQPIADTGS